MLSRDNHNMVRVVPDDPYTSTVCDEQVQSLLHTCQGVSVSLRNFGIIVNSAVGDEEREDVYFSFPYLSEQFKSLGIHFDHVIRVEVEYDAGKSKIGTD